MPSLDPAADPGGADMTSSGLLGDARAIASGGPLGEVDILATADHTCSLGLITSPNDPVVTQYVDAVGEARAAPDRKVAAMLAWKAYSFLAVEPVLRIWAARERVIDVGATNGLLRFDDAVASPRIAMAEPRVFVTADDPSARDPAAVVVDSAADLDRTLMRVWWDEHVLPVAERWRAEARLARHGLEAFAVSQAVSIVAAAAPGSLTERDRRLDRFVAALPTPHRHAVELIEYCASSSPTTVEQAGWEPVAIRTTCCLQYQLDAADYCVTCSLLDDDERTEVCARYGSSWRPRPRPRRR